MPIQPPFIFASEITRRWGALVTGGVLISLLGIWQGVGHLVKPGVYWAIALLGILVACYQTWLSDRATIHALQERFVSPEIKITFGSIWWGIGERGHFVVTAAVNIENPLGPPTAMKNLKVMLENHRTGLAYQAKCQYLEEMGRK